MPRSKDLNIKAVTVWARDHVPGFAGPVTAQKFSGGQSNPTYLLATPAHDYVLRHKPPGVLLKSAHAVDREFRVQRTLNGSDVPVARMLAYCADEAVIGSPFYIMDKVEGRAFDQPSMPSLTRQDRHNVIDDMNRVLASIHSIDLHASNLTDYGPPGDYCKRQTDRWTRQYRATQTETIPDIDRLIKWLERSLPPDDGQRSLVHGDYRLDNLLIAQDEPKVVAVLDWELSTIGHPFTDLASVLMQWSMPATTDGRGLAGVDRGALGLWSDNAFIEHYCDRRNLSGVADLNFYLAFCFFRMAAILQGVKWRALEGNASDPERGLKLGSYVAHLAKAGLEAAESDR